MTFVDALLSGRVGQIVACNLVDSTDLGVLSKATVRKVVRMAKRMGRSAPPNNDREAVGDLIRAVVATHSYYRSRRLPKSARPRAKLATRQFVTVVPRWLFIKVFKPSALVRNRVYLYRSGGRTQTHQDADFADVEALNGAANVFVPGATIGYFGPVWLADVQDCRGASGADRIRDL
ncbi:MAG TPA: hypothetical protein VNQ74_00540, partial [Burkholderiaceae bacterium]|nr:hypothetical protein [Burkholderiaceae bacterium]